MKHPLFLPACLLATPMLFCAFAAAEPPAPAASNYVADVVEAVHAGLCYDAAVQPQTSEAYVAAWGGHYGPPNNGTWRTSDLGASWRRVGPGGYSVEVSETNPNVLYAASGGAVQKSADGGENWSRILSGVNVEPQALEIFPGDHNLVYVGARLGRVHVSRDGGRTWKRHDIATEDGKPAGDVRALFAHPGNPDVLYAGIYGGEGVGGVFKSLDGGRTWKRMTAANARGMAVAPSNGDYVYTASAISHDGGATWFAPGDAPRAWMIAVHPADENVVFYSAPGTPIWASTDGGKLFYPTQGVGANYDGTEVEGMAVDARHDILWAAGDRIFKGERARSGKVRVVPSDVGFHTMSLSDIHSAPSGVWCSSDSSGVTYTTDGVRWTTTAMGMDGMDSIRHIQPSPTNPKIVYAGHEGRLYRSEDGGATWFAILGKWFPRALIDPVDPDAIYISTHKGRGDMLVSRDGGKTFEELGRGRFLAVHRRTRAVYAERPDGLHVSNDAAKTFQKISATADAGDWFLSLADPSLLFSARGAAGLFRSTDGGRTWGQVHDARVRLRGATRMAELGDGSIWLANPEAGLLRTRDGGLAWEQVLDVSGALAADPWDPHSLYMITHGGIWWVHPRSVQRQVAVDPPPAATGGHETRELNGPAFLDRSNTTYVLTRDIALSGRYLAMMPRGLKKVVIDGRGHTVSGDRLVFGDDAEDLTIRNCHFKGAGGGGAMLTLTNCRNLRIVDCTFEGAAALVSTGVSTDNVVIEDCRFTGATGAIVGYGRHSIRRCTFVGSGDAIRLTLADGAVVEQCVFEGPGVLLRHTPRARLSDNVFTAGQVRREP